MKRVNPIFVYKYIELPKSQRPKYHFSIISQSTRQHQEQNEQSNAKVVGFKMTIQPESRAIAVNEDGPRKRRKIGVTEVKHETSIILSLRRR